jgi:hypothetical protein
MDCQLFQSLCSQQIMFLENGADTADQPSCSERRDLHGEAKIGLTPTQNPEKPQRTLKINTRNGFEKLQEAGHLNIFPALRFSPDASSTDTTLTSAYTLRRRIGCTRVRLEARNSGC